MLVKPDRLVPSMYMITLLLFHQNWWRNEKVMEPSIMLHHFRAVLGAIRIILLLSVLQGMGYLPPRGPQACQLNPSLTMSFLDLLECTKKRVKGFSEFRFPKVCGIFVILSLSYNDACEVGVQGSRQGLHQHLSSFLFLSDSLIPHIRRG